MLFDIFFDVRNIIFQYVTNEVSFIRLRLNAMFRKKKHKTLPLLFFFPNVKSCLCLRRQRREVHEKETHRTDESKRKKKQPKFQTFVPLLSSSVMSCPCFARHRTRQRQAKSQRAKEPRAPADPNYELWS